MQIRATEMQGQAAEMQASALNIRAQAATLSFAELTNTAANALTHAVSNEADAMGAHTHLQNAVIEEFVETEHAHASDDTHTFAAAVAVVVEGAVDDDVRTERGLGGADDGGSAGDRQAAAGESDEGNEGEGGGGAADASGAVAASGSAMAASARFDALRAETARLTRSLHPL
jgi:nanoRNase/pAp phosphatase (c-di-AMP/oligoRNAs hydrolase)